jgi:hypothetical protein
MPNAADLWETFRRLREAVEAKSPFQNESTLSLVSQSILNQRMSVCDSNCCKRSKS